MAFTGRLGTSLSQLGQIELGVAGGGATVEASFTTDAFIQLYFRANAVLRATQSASFTADAVISTSVTQSASFTADAVVLASRSTSLTANAIIRTAQAASFVGDSVLKAAAATSFTADAIKRKGQTASFTANAIKRKTVSSSFSADAYIPIYRVRHARTGPHVGVDRDLDHTIAWAFDRYLRGESLQEVLSDIDARLSAREAGFVLHRKLLRTEAIVKASLAKSLLANAYIVIRQLVSFAANAFIQPYFKANAWITDPAIYLDNDVLTAPTWPISTTPRAAFITTAGLTHDLTNDPPWYDTTYESAWAKFTLSGTKTVILDTVMTGGDSVLELWSGGPGSWPSVPVDWSDDDVANEQSPYNFAERIQIELTAGIYWVLVHKFDEGDSDFNILLRMQTTT